MNTINNDTTSLPKKQEGNSYFSVLVTTIASKYDFSTAYVYGILRGDRKPEKADRIIEQYEDYAIKMRQIIDDLKNSPL